MTVIWHEDEDTEIWGGLTVGELQGLLHGRPSNTIVRIGFEGTKYPVTLVDEESAGSITLERFDA